MTANNDPRFNELVTTFCKLIYLAGQIGSPEAPQPKPTYYDRQEAAKYLTISVSTFDRCKKAKWIKPDHTIGAKSHRYTEAALDQLHERLKKESPPNGK